MLLRMLRRFSGDGAGTQPCTFFPIEGQTVDRRYPSQIVICLLPSYQGHHRAAAVRRPRSRHHQL